MRIFILGNGRSGSSMLGMILGSHPMITNIGEAYNLDDSFISKEKKEIIKKQGLCGVCGKKCGFWGSASKILGDNGIIVDTSKLVSWVEKFPVLGNKFIRITRSIYDRMGFFKNKKGRITEEIIKNHIRYEKKISNFLSGKDHFVVKYEELCRKQGLNEIMSFIGLPPTPTNDLMWNFWENMQHPIRGNGFANLLVKLHHGLVKESDLNLKKQQFMKSIGFNIKFINRSVYLSFEDVQLINRLGGKEIDRRLGYC